MLTQLRHSLVFAEPTLLVFLKLVRDLGLEASEPSNLSAFAHIKLHLPVPTSSTILKRYNSSKQKPVLARMFRNTFCLFPKLQPEH